MLDLFEADKEHEDDREDPGAATEELASAVEKSC